MPTKYIKDEIYEVIKRIVIKESTEKKKIVKDSEVIERLIKKGLEEEGHKT